MTSDRRMRILTVCTGNICRSPAAERLLARSLGPEILVTSAGTGALVGHPIAPGVAEHLAYAGASVQGFAARQVTESILRESDLVLPLTRAHRTKVVELAPATVRRTFTLRELARIAQHIGHHGVVGYDTTTRLADLAAKASTIRGMLAGAPDDDDVVDPWRGDRDLYAHSYAQVTSAVEQIIEVVVP